MILDSKHTEASILPALTDSLYLQFAQVLKSQDLEIFLCDNNNDKTDYFTILYTLHMHGVNMTPSQHSNTPENRLPL